MALVCGDRRLSYAQTLRCVAGFARELVAMGARGCRVALVCGNSLDMPVAMFAAHAAGAQVVPINPTYTARELSQLLADAEVRVVVVDDDLAATVEPLCAALGIAHLVRVAGAGTAGATARRLDVWKDDTRLALPEPLPDPDDLATLQYTGGTTGQPKGVNISHRQMAVNISQREAALPTRPDDERILCVMPLFHVFAVAMCLHLAAYCRGTLVIVPRYKAEVLLDLIGRERITRLPAGPTVFIGLLAHEAVARTDFSSLRAAYSGSAPLPEETMKRWREATGTPVLEGFGQTEAGPVLSYVRDGGAVRAGSVGPALPLTEIQIVDVESGARVLAVGEIGEVRASGPADHVGLPQSAAGNERGTARRLAVHRRHRRARWRGLPLRSAIARRTWPSSAATTSIRARSTRCSSRTRPSRRPPPRGCPIRTTAKRSGPMWC